MFSLFRDWFWWLRDDEKDKVTIVTAGMKQNLPGGDSAVVPPDPMPNSEVKRRSADGSVGLPHVRVGNCQASNKTKSSVEGLGFLFYLLFVGEGSLE